ncbi:MAG TPA: tripartite tricarboxylate transporter substrate-binding protein [Burkholderiales bacterium]|nr:tripartite tricarboxylate transporter substrate-binding protein [Burkholderiales bacterium]
MQSPAGHVRQRCPNCPAWRKRGFPTTTRARGMAWLAPVRTPPAVIKKLNSEMGEWLNMRVVHERFTAEGAEPGGTSPEAFAAIIKSEVTKWATVIRAAGIRPE